MCQFLSAIVLKNGDVLHHPLLDSHSELVTLFQLPDGHQYHQHFAKVELTPPVNWDGWEDVSRWRFRLDEDTVPGWWADVAATAEAAVRRIIERAILPPGEHAYHLDGLAIIGPGVTVRSMRGGRAYLSGGTLSAMSGGTLTTMLGGTLSAMSGGTLTTMRGGTLSAMRGGTLTAIAKSPYYLPPRILSSTVKLNKAAQAFLVAPPAKPRTRKATTTKRRAKKGGGQ